MYSAAGWIFEGSEPAAPGVNPQYCSRSTESIASVLSFYIFLSCFCLCSFIWWSRCKDCLRGHCPSWLLTCFDHLATLCTRLQQLLSSPQRTGIERFAKDFKSNQIDGHRCHDSSSCRTVPRFAWQSDEDANLCDILWLFRCHVSGLLQLPWVTTYHELPLPNSYPLNVPFCMELRDTYDGSASPTASAVAWMDNVTRCDQTVPARL